MSVFLWYSKASQETGVWLAEKLGIAEHGSQPPRDFQGSVICWGANPSEKFRWERRNFQSVFNDPRVVRPLLDRDVLLKKVSEIGIPVAKFITLVQPPAPELLEEPKSVPAKLLGNKATTVTPVAQTTKVAKKEPTPAPVVLPTPVYSEVCAALGVTEAAGFTACTPNGFKYLAVSDQETLVAALAAGRTCATTAQFVEKSRIRVFIANGMYAGAAKFVDTIPADAVVGVLSSKVSSGWDALTPDQVSTVLKRAVELKLIKSVGGTWSPHSVSNPNIRNHALTIAATLKFDFCAVDFSADGSGTVINIITTPNLREVTTVQSAITNAISSWVYKNTRTAKDILLEVINGSTCEEASSLLEELSSLKGTVKLALKKDGKASTNKVAGGADSPPAKSK